MEKIERYFTLDGGLPMQRWSYGQGYFARLQMNVERSKTITFNNEREGVTTSETIEETVTVVYVMELTSSNQNRDSEEPLLRKIVKASISLSNLDDLWSDFKDSCLLYLLNDKEGGQA